LAQRFEDEGPKKTGNSEKEETFRDILLPN